MAVSVSAGSAFAVPQELFQAHVPAQNSVFQTNYVPTGNGDRFLLNTQAGNGSGTEITVTLNWIAGLKK
jgi:hypothetical protein